MMTAGNHSICISLAIVLTSACSVHGNGQTALAAPEPDLQFEQIADAFSAEYAALELPGLELSFIANLEALGDEETLQNQKRVFSGLADKLASIEEEKLDACSLIDLSIMQTEVAFGLRRAELGLRYLKEERDEATATTLVDVPLGYEWYDFFLDRWNGADLDPDEIYAFGERELQRSVAEYDAIQRALGFEGDDEGLATHLAKGQSRLDGGEPTLKVFSERQERVWANFASLFPEDHGVQPAKIARSDRGESFPAPGYYEIEEGTFYYNLVEDGFEVRQADWLFLHEGTPGHHFQINAAANADKCVSRLPDFFHAGFIEGWAAYVETLGAELGLYETPEAQLAAVEWNMVRSVRVVLDVAINAYGWSDERALAYWRENVRGQEDVAQREIDRMKRWPAQVITYKYGSNVFETIKSSFAGTADEKASTRAFHDAAIAYGSMPLDTFAALLQRLIAQSAEDAETAGN